ncbi:DUF4343 domain-containing protein [Ahniella affigens]|uniref:DUF4343 domain-containing protein n=1 Tax=Ahniella affigens TaxID=2021234 RepID=A0A2P1PRS0_9GAMM|nr:ATP-grasp domain-containing protein [Ahniella affigens]AVP97539.1 DUF4343 domain-containing protein [Ahniella affigens]
MFSVAYLQDLGSGRLGIEEQLLKQAFEQWQVPVELYTIKRIHKRSLPLTLNSFIAGDLDAMHGAMRQLGIEAPTPDDYPECLSPFLQRRVWRATLGTAEYQILQESGQPLFIKPAERRKSFVGAVFSHPSDIAQFGTVSRRQEVWCSEVVNWISEYRVYVIGTETVAIGHYSGDPLVHVDLSVVRAAVETYFRSGRAPCAYAIDFGVLSTGQTALVESNDGFSVGAYHIGAIEYASMVTARWRELVESSKSGPS